MCLWCVPVCPYAVKHDLCKITPEHREITGWVSFLGRQGQGSQGSAYFIFLSQAKETIEQVGTALDVQNSDYLHVRCMVASARE